MTLTVHYAWLVAFLLALARALGWLFLVPPFSNRGVLPATVTVSIGSALALLVAPRLPAASLPYTAPALIGDLVVQVLTGAAIGYIVYLLLQTITVGGSLLDLMGGLNLPPSLDPLSLNQTPMLGQFYEQVAMVLLFVSGGYDALVAGFARSFGMPAFDFSSTGRVAETAVIDLATLFTSALEMAAPIIVVLFATQILLALLTKAAPQMNVWILGLPIQVFLAIALVAVSISALPGYVGAVLSRALGDTASLFGGR